MMFGEGGWMGFGGFMWLFWILLAVVVVWFVRSVANGASRNDRTKTALEILEKRYALGEIDSEEFERKKRDLMGT
jgi:putative membrane protein